MREIGTEWLSCQAMRQLQIAPFLESLGWGEDQVRLAIATEENLKMILDNGYDYLCEPFGFKN